MNDYKPLERQRLEELYRKQNVRINDLEQENRKLKESLDIATKCSSKEEDGIIRLSEENKKLKMSEKRYKNQYEFDEECLRKLGEENERLKNLKICGKTVEERIEIDKGVVRD